MSSLNDGDVWCSIVVNLPLKCDTGPPIFFYLFGAEMFREGRRSAVSIWKLIIFRFKGAEIGARGM